MSIASINSYNSGMLWGLLASALLHVLVVVTLPGFKVSLEDQKDFLTVQLDSASKPDPELIEPVELEPEKVTKPVIPSPSEALMPSRQSIQPQRQPTPGPTAIVPPIPNVPRQRASENIPVVQAPQRTSSVIVQQPPIENPIRREPTSCLLYTSPSPRDRG